MKLLIGLDNSKWLNEHIEDLWDPDDDMWLIKSAYIGGWGASLFPRQLIKTTHPTCGQDRGIQELELEQLGSRPSKQRREATLQAVEPQRGNQDVKATGQQHPRMIALFN